MTSHSDAILEAHSSVKAASSSLPGIAERLMTLQSSAANLARMDGVDCAIKKVAVPPASCQACASARQRMTWPVPISGLASARIRVFPGVSGPKVKLPPPSSTLQSITALAFQEKLSAISQYAL